MSMFSFSLNEENYEGSYESEDDAILGALDYDDLADYVYVGQQMKPDPVESVINVRRMMDYAGEGHDSWDVEGIDTELKFSEEQYHELESLIRLIVKHWADRHNLQPEWYLIDPKTIKKIIIVRDNEGNLISY